MTHRPSGTRRQFVQAALGGAAALAGMPAFADTFPSRPITLVVPFAAGGATDVTARRFAEVIAHELKTSVVVENRPSAGAFVAINRVIAAPRDGYTLLVSGTNALALNPILYAKLPYDPADMVPISTISRQPFAVSANPQIPTKDIREFVAWAKAKPDGVNMGTVGVGTTSHLLAVMIGESLGIKLRTVPYKGTSQSTVDLVGGLIDIQIDGISTGVNMHNSGKTRLLAGMGQAGERSILPADVKNFADAGYNDLVAYAEFGLFGSRNTPDAVIQRIHAATAAAAKHPDMLKLAAHGEVAIASASPKAYAERVESERSRWAPIVKANKLQLN